MAGRYPNKVPDNLDSPVWNRQLGGDLKGFLQSLLEGVGGLQGTPDDPTTIAAGDAGDPGDSQAAAAANHEHPVDTAAPTNLVAFGGSTDEGSGSALMRADAQLVLAQGGATDGQGLFWSSSAWAPRAPYIQFSAGTQSSSVSNLAFSNSNGVTFGLSGSIVTASVLGGGNWNLSAGTTSNNLTNVVFSNSNGVTFGLSGSTVTASVSAAGNINVSAGTTSNNLTNLVFANSNGVTFGLSGSTITASASGGTGGGGAGVTVSSYQNLEGFASALPVWDGSNSYGAAFAMPAAGTFEFLRFFVNMEIMANSSVSASNATQNVSAAKYSTINAVIYSAGTGASSGSLYSVMSASAGSTFLSSLSVGAVSTQASHTAMATWYQQGVTQTLSATTEQSSARYSFLSSAFSNFTFNRMCDVPLSGSLSAGNYWIMAGISMSTAGDAFVSRATAAMPGYNYHYGGAQMNVVFYEMGTATSLPKYPVLGAAEFSTAGGGTVSAFAFTDMTSVASHAKILFQLRHST